LRNRLVLFSAVLSLVAPLASVAAAGQSRAAQPRAARLAASSILRQINAVRLDRGLRPLRAAAPLSAAARSHSVEMGERGYFEHESADGTAFWRRVRRWYASRGFGYWMVGENLLWSSGALTAAEVVRMWMNSPPHRRNLLDRRWREIGLSPRHFDTAPGVFRGLSVTIVTADFGVRQH
jgi:uncharacterized protein YkwD